jgi:Mitotic-spindle organizing gamma-tubulin ring associated
MDAELERRAQAKEQLDTVQALSDILNTGLDRTTLDLLVQLLEAGVNPEVMHCAAPHAAVPCCWRACDTCKQCARMTACHC